MPRAWWCRLRCFENFGFNYIGPIDGHDLESLIPTLENIRQLKGPQFLHVVTKKGPRLQAGRSRPDCLPRPRQVRSGHGPAEIRCAGEADLHPGVWPVAVRHGRAGTNAWSASPRPCAKAPAWWSSTNVFPERYHDVGIAEQHAVTFAAGMACEGLKPVVAIYSTFLQRGYDQLIHDVAFAKPARGVCA